MGNADFVAHLDTVLHGRIVRVVADGDPVVHIPLRLLGYQHTSGELWYTSVASPPYRWTQCLGEAENRGCSLGTSFLSIDYSTGDHAVYWKIFGTWDGITKGGARVVLGWS